MATIWRRWWRGPSPPTPQRPWSSGSPFEADQPNEMWQADTPHQSTAGFEIRHHRRTTPHPGRCRQRPTIFNAGGNLADLGCDRQRGCSPALGGGGVVVLDRELRARRTVLVRQSRSRPPNRRVHPRRLITPASIVELRRPMPLPRLLQQHPTIRWIGTAHPIQACRRPKALPARRQCPGISDDFRSATTASTPDGKLTLARQPPAPPRHRPRMPATPS